VLLSLVFFVRIVAAFFSSFSILPEVTNGLLLNAIAMVLIVLLAVLSMIGEFTIRCFVMLQNNPVYAVREVLRREPQHRDAL
jgi:hypothetical protein